MAPQPRPMQRHQALDMTLASSADRRAVFEIVTPLSTIQWWLGEALLFPPEHPAAYMHRLWH